MTHDATIRPAKNARFEWLVPHPKARLLDQGREVLRFQPMARRREEASLGWWEDCGLAIADCGLGRMQDVGGMGSGEWAALDSEVGASCGEVVA